MYFLDISCNDKFQRMVVIDKFSSIGKGHISQTYGWICKLSGAINVFHIDVVDVQCLA